MTEYIRQIFDRQPFTASKDLQTLTGGRYIDSLRLHYKVANTTGTAVSVASALDLLQPITVNKNGSAIVRMRGSDLYAVNALFFGQQPFCTVAGSATDEETKIMGLDVPLWLPPAPQGAYSVVCERVAVSTADTEVITLEEVASDRILSGAHFHMVDYPGTTQGTTGFGNFLDLPSDIGDLIGLVFFSTTIPTASADTSTVQEVRVMVNNTQVIETNWHAMKADAQLAGVIGLESSPGSTAIVDNYNVIDLRKDPIPKGSLIRLDISGGVASEAYRVIPIFRVSYK